MVGDRYEVSNLRFEELQYEDLDLLSRVHFACVFNWLYNRKITELAEGVFRYCKVLDFLAVNENEAVLFARILDRTTKMRGRRFSAGIQAGEIISASTNTTAYVHTADYSASFEHDHASIAPTFEVAVRRGTGAGDSWNEGILLAEGLGLREEEKLLFANSAAARYISWPERTYATLDDMTKLLRETSHRLKNCLMF